MAEPRVINGVEELESLVGQQVGTGEWLSLIHI